MVVVTGMLAETVEVAGQEEMGAVVEAMEILRAEAVEEVLGVVLEEPGAQTQRPHPVTMEMAGVVETTVPGTGSSPSRPTQPEMQTGMATATDR